MSSVPWLIILRYSFCFLIQLFNTYLWYVNSCVVDHMELLFQVLLQFGDCRKVFDIKEPDDMNEVISKIKSMFAINAGSDLFLQEYEEEWNESKWVKASLYSTKNETETLNFIFMGSPCAVCQVTMYISHQKSSYRAVLIFFYFKSEVINISFPSFLFTIKVIKCKSQYR